MHHAEALLIAGRRTAKANGTGVLVSLVLHGLLAFLVLVAVARHTTEMAVKSLPQPAILPVDLIRLGDETRSPPAELRSPIPQQKAGRPQEASSPNPQATAQTGKKPVDALEAKLKALARLKQPNSPLTIGEGVGVSTVDARTGHPRCGDLCHPRLCAGAGAAALDAEFGACGRPLHRRQDRCRDEARRHHCVGDHRR